MANISTIYINNTSYDIKDSTARTGLTNVYTKTETDSAIAEAVGGITGVAFEVVTSLPTTGEAGTIYLISNSGSGQNIYDEYIYLTSSSRWEKIGTTDVDLSGYAKTADLGDLAYKDSASGSVTATGNITINSYKPEGSITVNAITPSGSISVGTGTANYTPAGSVTIDSLTPAGSVTIDSYKPEGTVAAPTITVDPDTTTVNSITAVGTLPTWSATVTNEVLSFSFSQGTLPTKGANTTVMTGASATASAPAFTGTSKAPTGSFSGTAVTPTGSFTGTGAQLKFTGSSVTPTGSFTGTSKAPTGSFTGTATTVTVE